MSTPKMKMSTTEQAPQEMPPAAIMTQMILSYMTTQAIYVAAKLGIADLLKDGPRSSAELAKETGTQARALYRVLRALAGIGVFTEVEPDCFALTPLAETLRSDTHGSLRGTAIYMGDDWHLRVWGDIMYSVQTGEPAADHVFGKPVFTYLAENPENAATFNDAMTSLSSAVVEAIMSAYDFSSIERIVDVAGGHGMLISSILKANPQMKGILFDVPSVIAGAHKRLEAAGVEQRCETVTGDFFESVPGGGDAYIMKHIIHDWDDERAVTILRNCHRVMRSDDKVLLVEVVVPKGDEPSMSKLLDIEMLLFTGGCERTEDEYAALFERAGFRLTKITPTASPYSVIEAVRR
jgi:ubiquinone/menaquinone biosynthesis C-methylase UbiE